MIDPDSSTACYRCLLTQSPVGPDGMPCDARECTESRVCFKGGELKAKLLNEISILKAHY